MAKTGKILVSTIGAAAAAGVTLAALRKLDLSRWGGSAPVTVYHVTPDGSGPGWAVESESADEPYGRYETKRRAVEEAREVARKEQPSRLVIHGSDGSIQRHHSYGTGADD